MGPNTNDETMMRKLVQNGMDIARFNFSHGDHEEQKGRMDMLKKIREEENKPIAILLDTKGPEIRTGVLKDGKKVQLEAGETFTLTTDEIVGDNKIVSITYKGLVEDVKAGSTILIDDGLIELKVKDKKGNITIKNGTSALSKRQHYYNANLKSVFMAGDFNKITIGSEYITDKLKNPEALAGDKQAYTMALYTQDEIKFLQNFQAIVGLRYIYHETFKNRFTPKLSLMYSPGAFNFRATYSDRKSVV